ncbi:MAG TPA: hypothetical protein VFO16_05585, partial [Pseudonocardiaceae bacterium]|nr:hypothetical protein [Pseudonocardiaceae bacterium]
MGRARSHHHLRRQYRRYYRRGPYGRPVLPLLVLAAVGMVGVALLALLATLTPIMLAGVGAFVVIRYLGRRHLRAMRRRQPGPMPVSTPAPSVTRTPPAPDWRATRARFAQLRTEYAQFECDPLAVLRLPALTDVTVPSTGRFVDAFAEAQALDTDTE